MKPEAELKSAWLITWEGTSDLPEDTVAAILSYRLSATSVKFFVEQLYAASSYTAREKLHFAKHPKQNPYRATMSVFQKISCGHNPSLYAREVTDLKVVDGVPTWKEPLSDPERRKRLEQR